MSKYDRPVPSSVDTVRQASVDARAAAVEAAREVRTEFLSGLREEFVEIHHALGDPESAAYVRSIDRALADLKTTE